MSEARIIGHVPQRVFVTHDVQTEPLASAGRYTFIGWCAVRGRNRRFSLPAAAWIADNIEFTWRLPT